MVLVLVPEGEAWIILYAFRVYRSATHVDTVSLDIEESKARASRGLSQQVRPPYTPDCTSQFLGIFAGFLCLDNNWLGTFFSCKQPWRNVSQWRGEVDFDAIRRSEFSEQEQSHLRPWQKSEDGKWRGNGDQGRLGRERVFRHPSDLVLISLDKKWRLGMIGIR